MSQHQGPPGPNHIYGQGTAGHYARPDAYDIATTLNCRGLTQLGFQHLLNNQAVLSHQVANLDTTTMAAAAARDAKEIGKKVKVIRSAAELSAEAQPLLAAIQQLQQQQHQTQEQLRAIQANQGCCTIM